MLYMSNMFTHFPFIHRKKGNVKWVGDAFSVNQSFVKTITEAGIVIAN